MVMLTDPPFPVQGGHLGRAELQEGGGAPGAEGGGRGAPRQGAPALRVRLHVRRPPATQTSEEGDVQ